MKINIILIFVITSGLTTKLIAQPDTMQKSGAGVSLEDSMTWPMLPGESLNELAAKFYPKNKSLRRQFVYKTQYLSQATLPNLKPENRFKTPTAIVIPTLTSLAAAKPIKPVVQRTSKKGRLRLSYNLHADPKQSFEHLSLDYEELITRNEFLKKEIAQLHSKITHLKGNLHNLKQVFTNTFSSTKETIAENALPKKTVNNKAKPKVKSLANKGSTKPEATIPKSTERVKTGFFDFSNQLVWLGVLLLSLFTILSFWLFKKFRAEKNDEFINELSLQKDSVLFNVPKLGMPTEKTALEEPFSVTELNDNMSAGEQASLSAIDEAKVLVNKNAVGDAIEYLKWSIKSEPKSTINIWLYLLELLRQQNLKGDFEKFAAGMHGKFNVMTPVWEDGPIDIVVPESLEEFPHIVEKLCEIWPKDSARTYLSELVNDNRNGERAGFGRSVLDEILLLIQVLDKQNGYWEVHGSI